MHREVFAGRAQPFLTVGETPGCTVEQARLYTDPARAEIDMVFQFEHVEADREGGHRQRSAAALADLKAVLNRSRWACPTWGEQPLL